ncbi:MAG: phage holin family protein [Angustibacter sp.]
MRSFAIKVGVNALAIWIATLVVPELKVARGDGTIVQLVLVLLLIGLIFGLVNAVIKPVVKVLALPFYVLTLGLVAFVVNALMLAITAGLAGDYFDIGSFWSGALPAAVIVTFVSLILGALVPDHRDD